MEALLSYPCSPLISFPAQHEESSSLLWPNQLVFPHENAHIYDANPPGDDRWQDHRFSTMDVVQEADDLLQDYFPSAKIIEGDNLAVAVQDDSLVMEDSSSLDDLLMASATAVEAGDMVNASAILEKIDSIVLDGITCGRYGAVGSSSFDHLACYFASSLRTGIARARTECHPLALASRLPAYQMLQELSPFIKFAHFTANQAILEATLDEGGVHVVDLNVGDGVQWSSLMSDLVRHGGSKPFRLTALGSTTVTATPGRWLSEFAESLGLPFRYDEVEDLHKLTEIICGGSSVIVSCDATGMSHTLAMDTSQTLPLLTGVIKVLQPKLVILIEDELSRLGRTPPPPLAGGASFVELFSEAWCHFAAVQESLASCFSGAGYKARLRLVEEEILGPSIEGAITATWPPHGSMTGGTDAGPVASNGFPGSGYRTCEISGFNIVQAKMLAGLFSRGFGVLHDKKGRLALCWKDRPLTSVSVWTPV